MITHDLQLGGIGVHVFTWNHRPMDHNLQADALDVEDNQQRLEQLKHMLSEPRVYALTFPTTGHRDVLQVFLATNARATDQTFLFTLITPTRLRAMLDDAEYVLDGLDMQVMATESPTDASVHTAVLTYLERVFPTCLVPRIEVAPWTAPNGFPSARLNWLLTRPAPGDLQIEPLDEVEALPSSQVVVDEAA